MNASLSSGGTSSLSASREVADQPIESTAFAREAVREYQASPEVAGTRPGKVLNFLSESLRLLKDGEIVKLFTYWIEELAGALKLNERLKSLVELTRDSFLGKLFGLGEVLEAGLDKIHGQTVLGVLTVAFGSLLGKEALGSLAQTLEGKVGLEELLQAKEAPGGLAAFLLAKAKSGLEIPREVWEQVRGPLGLPEWSTLGVLTESTLESVRAFDEQSGLKALRERLGIYFDSQFPGWRDHEAMAWVKDLEDPAAIASALGIDLKQPSTWEAALRVGAEGVGLVGGYLLLRRFLGANSPLPHAIVFNVALYRFFASEGMDTIMLKGFDVVRELETTVCAKINGHMNGFLGRYNLKPSDVGLQFKNGATFGFADGMEWIWEHAHENPAVSLVAVNAVTFHDWALLRFMKKFMGFVAQGAWKTAAWALENKEAAAALAVFGAVGYAKQREVVEDFAELIYPEPADFEKREQFLEQAAKVLGLNLDLGETVTEEITDPIYERLIKDPLEFLASGELKMQLFKDLAEGKVLFRVSPSGESLALGIVAHGNPVWHALNFELGVLESVLSEFADVATPGEEFNVWAVVGLGVQGYVIGRAAVGAGRGYVALFNTRAHATESASRPLRFLKSMLPGLTKENRYLWTSALRGSVDLGFVNATDFWNASRIARVSTLAQELSQEVRRGNIGQVRDVVDSIKGLVPDAPKDAYRYAGDLEVDRGLRQVEKLADELYGAILKGEDPTVLLHQFDEALHGLQSQYSRLLTIGTHLREGNVRLALREMGGAMGVVRAVEALSTEGFSTRSVADLQGEISRMEGELAALSPQDPRALELKRQICLRQAYLNPSQTALLRFEEAAFNTADERVRVLKLKEAAGQMEAVEKGVRAHLDREIERIVSSARTRGVPLSDPQIQREMAQLDDSILKPFWAQKKAFLTQLHLQYKKIPERLRTPELKGLVANATENTYLSKVVRGAKGRLVVVGVMLPLMFTMDYLAGRDEAERDFYEVLKGLGPDAGQLIIDVLPGIGTYSNFHTAVTGEELYTGRQLEGWARHSNWLWGTVGFAADALTVLTFLPSGSSSVAGNAAARLALLAARGSRTAERLRTAWPMIAKIADRMGGFENLVQSTMRYMNAAQDTRLAKGLRAVELGGMAVGATVTVGGVAANLIYAAEEGDEGIEVAEDFLPPEESPTPQPV